MIEIRIHGRGGQGAVIASKIIALAFFEQGFLVQSFPAFGVERRGAPVCAFARADEKPIRLRSEIYNPDYVIVLDINLIKTVAVTEGLKEDGGVLLNAPPEIMSQINIDSGRLAYIDASSIAIDHRLGSPTSPIINTAIVGAFAKFTGLLKMDAVAKAIKQETPSRQEENIDAAREAFKRLEIYRK